MRLGLFVLLTIGGFLIFALTMTFVPVLPVWANYAARVGFLVVFRPFVAGRTRRAAVEPLFPRIISRTIRATDRKMAGPSFDRTGFHLGTQVTYAPKLWGFPLVTLGFSIAWGWLMQKTGSLWGSVLFHAGADLLIILPIFSSFGAK